MKKIPVMLCTAAFCTQIIWGNDVVGKTVTNLNQVQQLETVEKEQIVTQEEEIKDIAINRPLQKWDFDIKKPLGNLQLSKIKVSLADRSYDTYELEGGVYIPLLALENMGFVIQKLEGGLKLNWKNSSGSKTIPTLHNQVVTFSEQVVYIGPFRFFCLQTKDQLLISVKALENYFEIIATSTEKILSPYIYIPEHYIEVDEEGIKNVGAEVLEVDFQRLYWEKGQVVEEPAQKWQLSPGEKRAFDTPQGISKDAKFLTTHLLEWLCEGIRMESTLPIGKEEIALLKEYEQKITKEEQNTEESILFPTFVIEGTMKYATNGFKKGEKVQVWAAQDGFYYWVISVKGQKVKVPWRSVSIPKNPQPLKNQPTKEQIEGFINSTGMKSKTAYLIWSDLSRQYTYVFEDKGKGWELIRRMACSSGNNVTPTPTGEFELTNRVPYFGLDKGYRCKNAYQIFGDYLYHSVLFDVTGSRIISGYNQLGQQASHGCIRLAPEDSLWLYETMQKGTKVWIR
ncbi:hypothetical protein CS063_06815 [Sporanaerobium hydrogeniformans]|uniref:Uncharacterized protein n=1 Tax=Sporanaerobium hydrogeniformans TaxID=3072179 RepID=A0AC61DCW6_9FIRM|nr:L,D-transpeptidase [Sporanaerobium hydrogeniformans]PHV71041.1 hypothetical protein CS063_06815 [Sporanaerobium hydrogeniformans]